MGIDDKASKPEATPRELRINYLFKGYYKDKPEGQDELIGRVKTLPFVILAVSK